MLIDHSSLWIIINILFHHHDSISISRRKSQMDYFSQWSWSSAHRVATTLSTESTVRCSSRSLQMWLHFGTNLLILMKIWDQHELIIVLQSFSAMQLVQRRMAPSHKVTLARGKWGFNWLVENRRLSAMLWATVQWSKQQFREKIHINKWADLKTCLAPCSFITNESEHFSIRHMLLPYHLFHSFIYLQHTSQFYLSTCPFIPLQFGVATFYLIVILIR